MGAAAVALPYLYAAFAAAGAGAAVYSATRPTPKLDKPAPPPVAPPVAPPAVKPLADDTKRKRLGRQETILTSRSALSDAPPVRPTLLGQ